MCWQSHHLLFYRVILSKRFLPLYLLFSPLFCPSCRHKKKNTRSFFKRTQISFGEAFSLWQINLHELILRVKGLRLASWVLTLLCRLLPAPH